MLRCQVSRWLSRSLAQRVQFIRQDLQHRERSTADNGNDSSRLQLLLLHRGIPVSRSKPQDLCLTRHIRFNTYIRSGTPSGHHTTAHGASGAACRCRSQLLLSFEYQSELARGVQRYSERNIATFSQLPFNPQKSRCQSSRDSTIYLENLI